MNWKTAFQASTTNIAFNLSLSRRMVEMLVVAKAFHDRTDRWNMMHYSHFVTSMKCLGNRGLVQHHNKPDNYKDMDYAEKMVCDREHRHYTLTPAGLHVYELCVLAGLITEQGEAANAPTSSIEKSA